jgi:hypothetical protein
MKTKITQQQRGLRQGSIDLNMPEVRNRVRLAVLQKIHMAMAGIENRRAEGQHTEWNCPQAMEEDYAGLLACREELLSGADLAKTQNPRLFALRELVMGGGASHILHDGEYALCGQGAWLRIGSVHIRVERDAERAHIRIYPSSSAAVEPVASTSVSFEQARGRHAALVQ